MSHPDHPNGDELTSEALSVLVPRLQAFGSTLSKPHREALAQIVGTYSGLASGTITGRFAADLPVGCGKSQSLVAWCTAVSRLKLPYSVAIAASRVESLCDLYRDMVSLGVPEAQIGLIHSYSHDQHKASQWLKTRNPEVLSRNGRTVYASLPATEDNDKRQIVLVSHNLIKGQREVDRFNSYLGCPRSLVVWDESMIVSDSRSITHLGLRKALGYWGPEVDGQEGSTAKAAFDYLGECLKAIDAEMERQAAGASPQALKLPERTEVELEAYLEAMTSGNPDQRSVLSPLRQLVGMSQGKLRVAKVSQSGGGVLSYDIVVPPSLRNIVVLDASYHVRELEKMDSSIQPIPGFNGQVKRYSSVVINHLIAPSGRESTERSFTQKGRDARKMSLEVVDIIKREIPAGEPVLIFTFKPRPRIDIISRLKDDMAAAGVDIKDMVQTSEGPKPRFAFLTWGLETSISEYQHCPNVIFVGVLHRSDHDLAASIAGQRNELLSEISPGLVQEVRRSEIVHGLYQAMGRGSARGTANGEAHAMRVWLTHADELIREPLSFVMPGVVWKTRVGRFQKGGDRKTAQLAEAIIRTLRTLPEDVAKIYTAKVHGAIKQQQKTTPDTWKAAVQRVCEAGEWSIEGKSFVRGAEALFGIDQDSTSAA